MSEEAKPYERPDCWRIPHEQMLKGSTDDFARWRAEAAPVQERNAVRYRARCERKKQIEVLAAQVWPAGSDALKSVLRALAKAPVEAPPDFADILRMHERDGAHRREDAARKTTQDAERERKLIAAGAFLAARGKKLGSDYEPSTAIKTANSIAREEAIAEETKQGGFTSFGGDDYCTQCAGWDMTSDRCACGNCRVGWESDGDFEDMHVYAQAH